MAATAADIALSTTNSIIVKLGRGRLIQVKNASQLNGYGIHEWKRNETKPGGYQPGPVIARAGCGQSAAAFNARRERGLQVP